HQQFHQCQPQDGLVVLPLFEIGHLRTPIHFRPCVGPTFGGVHAMRPVTAAHRLPPFIPSTMAPKPPYPTLGIPPSAILRAIIFRTKPLPPIPRCRKSHRDPGAKSS